ncbi:hypothetical protein IW261DRAFT_1626874 [Armillaria novae-zelandiae]|uniref:Uncharacterized protein n=1 Tax=Armillaria novae-zelandiae TaxID=153914 RepID=A0AA39P833_9AGAR|nr:hypothetical protein IW261DRAFT_1626874 [Armillaria novae-zelandiae]
MSIQKSKNTSSEILHATAQRVQQHRPENYIGCVNSENHILSNGNRLFNNESDTHIQAREDFMNNCDGHAYPHSVFPDPDRGVYDVEQLSLPLGSPALIYSTRGSGATLSPTAPFGGLLSQQQGLSGEGAHEYLPSTSVAGKVKSLVLTLLFAIIRGRMKTQCYRIVIPYRFDFPPAESFIQCVGNGNGRRQYFYKALSCADIRTPIDAPVGWKRTTPDRYFLWSIPLIEAGG